MAVVLFVHGTGVRKPAFMATFALIQAAFEHYRLDYPLAPCLWGDDLGATTPKLSLPQPIQKPEAPERWTAEQEMARWELLYYDAFFELRLLVNRPRSAGLVPPAALRQAQALWERIEGYQCSDTMGAFLRRWGLEEDWPAAWASLIGKESPAKHALFSSPEEIGEPAQAIARAVVARLLAIQMENERPLLDAGRRDELVALLLADWQARVAGVGTFLLRFFLEQVQAVSTPLIRWKRGDLSLAAAPAMGDILLYQARGQAIRDFVRRSIEAQQDDVVLLAHSLGGIACVDLLALQEVPGVKKLITVGSQAAVLQEIGALNGLPAGTNRLPPHFPEWLNLYDRYDFLSYVAGKVFESPRNIIDTPIESGQPFPQSHSAYWANPETWAAIRSFLT